MTIDGFPLASDPETPLISIITVVYNNCENIARAMDSVFAQTYRNIEYILIDGGSTDGTTDIIRRYEDKLGYWHSAPDKGIGDAFNSGVALARGDIIGLVNSDDWMSPDQVERGVATLQSTDAPLIFGDLLFYRPGDDRPLFRQHGRPDYRKDLWYCLPTIMHPTSLVRRQVYEEHGLFDTRWKIAVDYDWFYRLAGNGVYAQHVPSIVGHMSLGGVSDRKWLESLGENAKIARQHGSPPLRVEWKRAMLIVRMSLREAMERVLPGALSWRIRNFLNRTRSSVEKE
ncbi:MAG: glycosyltransferase family 2 protein [Pacificimonas sp.]